MPLQPGLTAEIEQVVVPELTADALGNHGVQVFATPFVINLMELTCNAAMKPHLPAGAISVGTMVEIPTPQGPFAIPHVLCDADVRGVPELTAEVRRV